MGTCSILVPAYNVEKYLGRALDSIIYQTYKDLEIILIDDGSTDSTPQICDEYGEKYNFIHVYHQKNVGLSKTRERLLEKATGKYIFWLDSDDYYDPSLLEKAVKVFESNDVDIVYWNYVSLIQADNKIIKQYAKKIEPSEWREMNIWGLYPMVWMYASRRELWEGLKKLPNDVDLTDDVWFTPQIVVKTNKITSLGECLYYYDQTNENSIMHAYTGKRLCRAALALYRIMKMNQEKWPNVLPMSVNLTRRLLVQAYCVHCVHPDLTGYQIDLIKASVKDLNDNFKQRKIKKLYLMQYCVLHSIDFVCCWYGRKRIRKFERQQNK